MIYSMIYSTQYSTVGRDGHKYIKMYFQIKYQIPTFKMYQNKIQNTAAKKCIKIKYCIFVFSKYYKILLSKSLYYRLLETIL